MEDQKHPGGRPLKFKTADELEIAVNNYFDNTEKPTLAGLAFAIGICRKSLYNYADKDEFLHIIKRAKERVEVIYEERLLYENNPTGLIFALKNMGWSDKHEEDHSGTIILKVMYDEK